MSSAEQQTVIDKRQAYMKGEGFVLFNDMSRRLLEDVALQRVMPIPRHKLAAYETKPEDGLYDSTLGIGYVLNHLADDLPTKRLSTLERTVWFGMSKEERVTSSRYVFEFGADDTDFTWHFSGAVAAAAVHAFVDSGKITTEQAANLTITDWANIIGTGWFSGLVHTMALTRNGVWGRFGTESKHYKKHALVEHLADYLRTGGIELPANAPLNAFNVSEQPEPEEGNVYLTAALKQLYREVLKDLRRTSQRYGGGSIGCPVVRRTAALQPDARDAVTRAQELHERGYISINDKDGRLMVSQEFSAIDLTLSFIAARLRAYDEWHGTPVFDAGLAKHEHRHPSQGVLFRPIETQTGTIS